MRIFREAGRVLVLEFRYYWSQPRLLLAAFAVAFIPALYVIIYLASVWDPASHLRALPVALVNLDRATAYEGRKVALGQELVRQLTAAPRFDFVPLHDAEEARLRVRQGGLAFALIVPAGFSAGVLSGSDADDGLEVFVSEGNSFQVGQISRQFAAEIARELNERVNAQRWEVVLTKAAGSRDGVLRLRTAMTQLKAGAQELAQGISRANAGKAALASGARRIDEGADRLTAGVKELGGALRTLDARQATLTDLQRLGDGARELVRGQVVLGSGLFELGEGSRKLTEGLAGFRDEARNGIFVPDKVVEGSTQAAEASQRIEAGIRAASEANKRLHDGSVALREGIQVLSGGARAQSAAVRSIVTALPPDQQLDELTRGTDALADGARALAAGGRALEDGARRLVTGVDLVARSLPATPGGIETGARGFADAVRPRVEVAAPVMSNGAAYAPNFIPAALWLGAGIVAFLVHVRVMSREAQAFYRLAQFVGKIAAPALVTLAQVGLVVLAVHFALHMRVVDMPAFVLILAVSALTFLAIIFFLTRAFGDAGKALAILFLAVQLSSSGGVLPVQLSGGVFEELSPWLPLTWVVRAIKAAMFGAYDGDWQQPFALVALAGFVTALLSCWIGRWRYIEPAAIRPAVDF